MKVGFYLDGAEELRRNLDTLDSRLAKNVIRDAVRDAQKIMLKAAIANARALPKSEKVLFARGKEDIRMSELIARNIVIAAPRRQIPGSYSLHVQMRRNVPEFIHTAKGAHTRIEFNVTTARGFYPQKIGATVGVTYIPAAIEYGHGIDPKSAARPFMRPAAERSKGMVIQKLVMELRVGLLREAIQGRYK
jgi:hypothetical protein